MIKISVHQKITVTNTNASNNRSSKYTKQKLTEMKEEIHNSTIKFGESNTPLSITDKTNLHIMR